MPVARNLLDYLSTPSLTLPRRRQAARVVREILSILAQPQSDGGATYSLYFGDQMGAPLYAVGLDSNLTKTVAPDELPQALVWFLRAHRELLTHPRCSLGVWQARDADGVQRAWIDVAVLVYNETIARAFAREGNQIALFDLREGGVGEVYIGGTGESMMERLRRLDEQDRPATSEGGDA
jgi:hypothetical protein